MRCFDRSLLPGAVKGRPRCELGLLKTLVHPNVSPKQMSSLQLIQASYGPNSVTTESGFCRA